MSSSDSEDGYYSNVVKNMEKLREECMKKLESESMDFEKNSGKSATNGGTNKPIRNTVSTAKTIQNNVTNVPLNDSVEDTNYLDEIIAKNAKPPPRTRGRKKKEPPNSTNTAFAPPAVAAAGTRGRGRGRGAKRGRASKNNVASTVNITNTANNACVANNTMSTVNNVSTANNITNTVNNACIANNTMNTVNNVSTANNFMNTVNNTAELLNNMVGCDASLIEDALFMLTGTRGRGRKRRQASFSPNSSVENLLQDLLSDCFNGRGRSRGGNRGSSRRARGSRGRGCRPTVSNLTAFNQPSSSPLYPTYSVGNTDEYPDRSDDIPLFSKPKNQPAPSVNQTQTTDDVSRETENSEDNEPLSVKVIWKSCQVFKFTIRKYQKITQIFEKFAEQENVGADRLLFTYNDKILTSNDTPASIDYNIAKFIDGGVVSKSVNIINSEKSKVNGINIKFQCQNRKKPLEITIGKDEKILLAMNQCAERLEVPLNKLKFEFDGDAVTGSNTPQQMGIEDGDCIDVGILS